MKLAAQDGTRPTAAFRAAVGRAIEILIDAHGQFDVPTAIDCFDAALAEFNGKMPNVELTDGTPREGEALFSSAAKTKGVSLFK